MGHVLLWVKAVCILVFNVASSRFIVLVVGSVSRILSLLSEQTGDLTSSIFLFDLELASHLVKGINPE